MSEAGAKRPLRLRFEALSEARSHQQLPFNSIFPLFFPLQIWKSIYIKASYIFQEDIRSCCFVKTSWRVNQFFGWSKHFSEVCPVVELLKFIRWKPEVFSKNVNQPMPFCNLTPIQQWVIGSGVTLYELVLMHCSDWRDTKFTAAKTFSLSENYENYYRNSFFLHRLVVFPTNVLWPCILIGLLEFFYSWNNNT